MLHYPKWALNPGTNVLVRDRRGGRGQHEQPQAQECHQAPEAGKGVSVR